MANAANSSSDNYYFLPYTLPVHLPGLVSTNPADSPHMPIPQKAIPPEVPGFTDVPPERVGTDLGMETSFKFVPNDYEVLKDMILMVHFQQLSAAGGGNSPRYPQDPVFHCMEYIQFQIGGQTISQKSGDELHFRNDIEVPPEEFDRLDGAQRITTSLADRITDAATVGGFWCFPEIPMWWSDTAAKHWHQYACQRQTRINIKWRGAEYCLQQNAVNAKPTPAAGSNYIVECYLRFRTSALDTAVKDTYINAVKAQGSNGLNYLTQFSQRQENVSVLTGATSTTIQLTNFNKPTYMLRFLMRAAANLAANYTINDRWTLTDFQSYQADASGHRLWPKMSTEFSTYMVNGKEFLNSPCTYHVYHVLHSDYADVNQYPMGCVEYGKLQNPTLTLNFATALGADQIVDVFANCYDYIRLVITQDNRSAVNLEQPI
jgi:hypothetical protein